MNTNNMLAALTEVFELLCQTQPLTQESDVSWVGPYYIPRSSVWAPTYFRIIDMKLHLFVSMPEGDSSMVWDLKSCKWEFTSALPFGFRGNAEKYWTDVLTQLIQRLRAALKNPSAYNRMVLARLPLACRTGKIQRAFTWLQGEEPGVDERMLQHLESAHSRVDRSPRLKKLTVADYLATAAIAYNAAFEDMVPLSPVEKYKSRADGRHGGMLDLPPNNAKAFTQWYQSRRWAGAHPWEIVYGNPHGIMMCPHYDQTTSTWSLDFSVHTQRLYVATVKMAIALAAHANWIEFHDRDRIIAALRGTDLVELGPGPQPILFAELHTIRPDAIRQIHWDPIPQITPITADQLQKLRAAIPVTRKAGRKLSDRVKAVEQQAVGIPNEGVKESIAAAASSDGPTTEPEEEERGPSMFSPAQVRNATITWPDADLIDNEEKLSAHDLGDRHHAAYVASFEAEYGRLDPQSVAALVDALRDDKPLAKRKYMDGRKNKTKPLVVIDPEILSGRFPVFAGTRVPIQFVLASLDKQISWDRVIKAWPFLTQAHIAAARAYVAKAGETITVETPAEAFARLRADAKRLDRGEPIEPRNLVSINPSLLPSDTHREASDTTTHETQHDVAKKALERRKKKKRSGRRAAAKRVKE